jgi:glycosyltransferase involved in cell wall biosynthesis
MIMRTILITAYAADPFKGSEDGTGWNTACAIARTNRVVLVTRRNNLPHIERYLREHPDPVHAHMRFVGHDLSERAMRWKKRLGERGYVAYFYLWQRTVPAMVKRAGITFDVAHALNFHSDSTPQFLWKLGKPVVWGPVGHHPSVPRAFVVGPYGWRTYLKDQCYNALKWHLRNLDPFFRRSVQATDAILAINSSVAKAMNAPDHKVTVLPAVAATIVERSEPPVDRFNVLSVGRFVYMKGFDLSIRAFAAFVDRLPVSHRTRVTLTLVGKGEEKQRLQLLAVELGIGDRIVWVDWVDRAAMDAIYRNSHVFLFPSHEGAGMVVPEAMAYAIPTICIDNVGPGELVGDTGITVPYGTPQRMVVQMAQALVHYHQEPVLRMLSGLEAKTRQENHFTWEHKADVINAIYDRLTGTEQAVAVSNTQRA